MKYVSKDHLEDFEFHNAVLEFDSYKDKTPIAAGKSLNVHEDEKQKTYQYDITLVTLGGEQKNTITISYRLDDHENTTQVTARIRYDKKDYIGNGTDYLWIDAIADLQKQLPDGVILKCCIACKHGSLCPVGNSQNQVFCVSDSIPTEKSDLFFYTEDEVERRKRSREYFDQCGKFEPQEENYFTYNDFYYYLKNDHNS